MCFSRNGILAGFLLLSCLFKAQNIDSLKQALTVVKDDTMRCYILAALAEGASDAEWPKYNTELKEFAEAQIEKMPSTHPQYRSYSRHFATALNNMGFLKERLGETAAALEYYDEAIKIHEKIGNKQGAATALSNMGAVYNNQGNIPKALEHFERSLKLREEIGDKQDIANSINKIGTVYSSQGDLNKALEYFEKSLKIRTEIGDKKGIAYSLNNIGIVYKDKGELNKALEYHQKSAVLFEDIGNKRGLGTALNNSGTIHNMMKDYTRALEDFTRSLKIREETNDRNGIAYSLGNIGEIYFEKKNISEAHAFAIRSMKFAEELGYPQTIAHSSNLLYKISKAKGDYQEALRFYETYITMRDSVKNEETRKASVKSQLKNEYEKKMATDSVEHAKESEIRKVQIARQESELKAKKKEQYALFGGLGLVLIFSGFTYNRFRLTQKQKKIIESQKLIVEVKQREILDSIHYAKRIQRALITNEKYIHKNLNRLN